MKCRRASTISLLLSLALAVAPAYAQNQTSGASLRGADVPAASLQPARRVDVTWTAPAGCPNELDVEAQILRLLATSTDHRDIDVRMVVTRGSDGTFVLSVDLRAPVGGTRSLEHSDCGAVTRAAALVVALAIDADAVAVLEEQTPTSSEPDAAAKKPEQNANADSTLQPAVTLQAKPVVEKPPEVADEVEPNARLDNSWSAHVALGAHVEATFSPNAAWGPLLAGGVGNRWFLAEAVIGGIPGYVVTVPGTDVGAKFEALWVEADVCAGMLRRVVNVALCVAGREYWIRATGRGVDEILTPTTAVFAMAGGPWVALEMGAWRVLGMLNGVVPLARPAFVVDNLEGVVFRPPKVGISGRLAVSLSL